MNFGKDKLHAEVLNKERINVLKNLSGFKDKFYLAGGTALALQIGHRISVDFDFFTFDEFKNEKLLTLIEKIFNEFNIAVVQNEIDTLTFLLNNNIKISLFKLPYKNVLPFVETEHLNLAQAKEIGIMKLLALFRATYKDYVDIYYILKKYSLEEIIDLAKRKHPDFDVAVYLRALISFDDVDEFPITFMPGFEVERDTVFKFIEETTIKYIKTVKN